MYSFCSDMQSKSSWRHRSFANYLFNPNGELLQAERLCQKMNVAVAAEPLTERILGIAGDENDLDVGIDPANFADPGRHWNARLTAAIAAELDAARHEARHLYETVYCARGDMENRIKECQLDLFADRTSATTMRANQLRLWFAAMAYVLVCALRRMALQHTQFAAATCGTIRLKLFKIGALVRVSVPRIKVAMAFCLSLPKRVRPRPFALDRRGALTTQNRHRDIHQQVRAPPHGARHDSPRLPAGSLARIPCTARAIASDQRPL